MFKTVRLLPAILLCAVAPAMAANCTNLGTVPVALQPLTGEVGAYGLLTGCFDFAIASSSSITVAGLDNVTAGWVGPQATPFATVNVAIDHLTLTSAAIQTEIQPSQVAALQTDLQTPSGLFTYKSGAVWTFADLPAGNFEIQLSLIGSPAQYYQLGISAVPEPKGAAMFAAGLAGLGVLVRRRSAGHASRGLLSKP